jgi:hypothetical protein
VLAIDPTTIQTLGYPSPARPAPMPRSAHSVHLCPRVCDKIVVVKVFVYPRLVCFLDTHRTRTPSEHVSTVHMAPVGIHQHRLADRIRSPNGRGSVRTPLLNRGFPGLLGDALFQRRVRIQIRTHPSGHVPHGNRNMWRIASLASFNDSALIRTLLDIRLHSNQFEAPCRPDQTRSHLTMITPWPTVRRRSSGMQPSTLRA